MTFAAGARAAARWLVGIPPGLYGMSDVLGVYKGRTPLVAAGGWRAIEFSDSSLLCERVHRSAATKGVRPLLRAGLVESALRSRPPLNNGD
jgi:hypothetical protein